MLPQGELSYGGILHHNWYKAVQNASTFSPSLEYATALDTVAASPWFSHWVHECVLTLSLSCIQYCNITFVQQCFVCMYFKQIAGI